LLIYIELIKASLVDIDLFHKKKDFFGFWERNLKNFFGILEIFWNNYLDFFIVFW
jgi:hypothetical protein